MDGSDRIGATPRRGAFAARLLGPFERLIDPFAPDDRREPPRPLGAFMRWALRDSGRALWLLAAASLAVGAADAGVLWMIGGLVDRASAAGPEAFFATESLWLGLLVFMLAVAKPVTMLMQSALSAITLNAGLFPMTIWRLHRHTLGQPMRFFEEDFTGRLAQKQVQTANAVNSAVVDTLTAVGMLVSYLATMTAALLAADWRLALVGVAWTGLFGLALWRWLPEIRARAQRRAEARAGVTGQLVDSLGHVKTVKLFAHGEREEAAARRALTRYREAALDFGRTVLSLRGTLAVLNGVVSLAMVGMALWLWSAGLATIGDVAMATTLILRLTQMAGWMSMSALSIFGEIGTIEDGAATLSPRHGVRDREGAAEPEAVRGGLRFEGVTFRYGRETGGIERLDLDIAPGEKVGLVGRSGAGKSTVVSLLLRLYDVEGGRITLDGADIRDLTQDGLRRAVGTVTQETAIFNRSALANLLYGRPEATLEEAMDAARRARAHEFIEGLRDGKGRTGYAAHLGERGVKLSGGQRQRIALARAILKDAPILVLDEATSALDSEVEAEIQQALAEVMEEKTVLAIAHRLSTIAQMDRIVVMDAGRVVEQGPHEALLAQGGLYAELWARQSGGFIGAEAAE